jgi:putative ABC transport system permease protein
VQLPVVAADVQRMFRMYPELQIPKEQLEEMSRVKTGAIVSKSLARRFNWHIGDRVPIKSSLWQRKDGSDSWPLDIVGIYEPAEASPALNDLFFINIGYFDDARAWGAGAVQLFILRVADQDKAGEIAKAVDAMFENSPFRTRTRSESAYAAVQWRQLQDLRLISNSIVGAVAFTLIVVVWSTMSQAIRQRFSEFATLMTFGFSPARIAFMVMCEGLLLCVVAAAIGLAIATAAFPWVAQLFGAMKMQPGVIAFGIGIAVAVGLASSVLPAIRAARLSIVDALSER